MAELEAAKQALGAWTSSTTEAEEPPVPASPSADGPWPVPNHLLRYPALREAAYRAVDSGRAAAVNATDFQAVVQHGLRLQELASMLGNDHLDDQQLLLHHACEVYGRANELRDGRAAVVLFNWAVALSDISRLARSQPAEAVEYLSAAAMKYAAALSIDPNNSQALNNWGLILQDMASLSPPEQRPALLRPAVARFRAAIRLQPDSKLTSRFSYNLGTVLYSHACSLQDRPSASGSGGVAATPANSSATANLAGGQSRVAEERAVRQAFAHAAQYIVMAFALQPGVVVYEQSLAAVQRLLPAPYLRAGPLLVAAPGTEGAPVEEWVQAWVALDGQVLQSVRPPAAEAGLVTGPVPNVAVDLEDLLAAQLCWDPSLPPGIGIWLGLKSRPRGAFLVAQDMEDAEGWVDALSLLILLHRSGDGKAEQLQAVLMSRRQRQQPA